MLIKINAYTLVKGKFLVMINSYSPCILFRKNKKGTYELKNFGEIGFFTPIISALSSIEVWGQKIVYIQLPTIQAYVYKNLSPHFNDQTITMWNLLFTKVCASKSVYFFTKDIIF